MALKCIQSWKDICKEYDIIEWNEDNFDLSSYAYTREAYDARKWAFVTDVVRLYALANYGGIYMDTDVEVIRPLDSLLQYQAVSGFESDKRVLTGLMASEKNNPMIVELLNDYKNRHFLNIDGEPDYTTNVEMITKKCQRYGLVLNNTKQTINSFTILPKDYLCPKDAETKVMQITKNTLTIHHFDGSWLPEDIKLASRISQWVRFPGGSYLAMFISTVRYKGIKNAFFRFGEWMKRRLNQNRNGNNTQ